MLRSNRLRLIVPLALVALLACTGSAARADLPFFDFAGFSYLDGEAWQAGTVVTVAAKFNPIQPNPIWPLDLAANEYTVLVEDLEIASVLDYGGFLEVTYSGGTIAVYEDAVQNGIYAPNPPNGAVPATFSDGALQLGGAFTELVVLYDVPSGVGTVSGFVDWSAGAKLATIGDPVHWTFFGGVSNHAGLGIPAGYDLAWDPQIYGPDTPLPVSEESWGAIKARFGR